MSDAERVHHGRTWSDWAGFLSFVTLSAFLLWRSGSMGLLLLPILLHEVGISATFLFRGRPRATTQGWRPRAVAFANTFIILGFMTAAAEWRPEWLAPSGSQFLRDAGFLAWAVGATVGLLPLYHLRHSFSIVPQARELVTSGPYALARHPIYALYIVQFCGLWIGHLTVPFTLAIAGYFALLRMRIGYEEAVLTAAFPEYAAYRARVGAFCPRLPRWTRPGPDRLATPA
jgi:protein-S-isoprenylcysteine O-methyltransferase Ste14